MADFLSHCSIGPAKRGDVSVVWERDLIAHSLPNGTQGLLINRDGLVVSWHADPNASHGVWRNGILEYAFGTFEDNVYTGTISDAGTFAGQLRNTPTVWRCG